MAHRQEEIPGLDRDADKDDEDSSIVVTLLREVLKELRQIRGILAHIAKDAATERADEQ
jgi:hypothetical protein